MQKKFVIEPNILHSVLKIFCPALPFKCPGVSEIHGQTPEMNSPHQKSKKVHINICPQTIIFRCAAQQNFDLSLVDFYLWDTSKSLLYSAPIENEDTSSTNFLCLSKYSQPPGDL